MIISPMGFAFMAPFSSFCAVVMAYWARVRPLDAAVAATVATLLATKAAVRPPTAAAMVGILSAIHPTPSTTAGIAVSINQEKAPLILSAISSKLTLPDSSRIFSRIPVKPFLMVVVTGSIFSPSEPAAFS